MRVLKELYQKLSMQQSIVFVEQRSEADSVSKVTVTQHNPSLAIGCSTSILFSTILF